MSKNVREAQEAIFGEDGLRATNFKLFPGSNRDATADEISEELLKSMDQIKRDEFEEIEL